MLLWIAAALEKNKDLAGARQTIDAIPAADPESQARQLSFLAEIDAAQHNFPAALSACDQIHADLCMRNGSSRKPARSKHFLPRIE